MDKRPEMRLASSIHTLPVLDVFTALVTGLQGVPRDFEELRARTH